MEASGCREHLSRLLDEENLALGELEALLTSEYEALLAKNVAALEETAETRRTRIGALVRIEEERRSLCRMLGHSVDPAGVAEMLKWCDPQSSLASQWSARGERAKRCKELNDRNGALVTARLKRVETLVAMVTGKNESAATYGPRAAYSTPHSGRILTVEA